MREARKTAPNSAIAFGMVLVLMGSGLLDRLVTVLAVTMQYYEYWNDIIFMVRPLRTFCPIRPSDLSESTSAGTAPTSAGIPVPPSVKVLPNVVPSSPDEEKPPVFRCLYCDLEKPKVESTLEHAIPQFLGGAQAPLHYKLRNVCAQCNNVLGLHVDASYARSWSVTNGLAIAARKLYTGPGHIPLPLVRMGIIQNMPGLTVPEGMAAEFWVGPSGENTVRIVDIDQATTTLTRAEGDPGFECWRVGTPGAAC